MGSIVIFDGTFLSSFLINYLHIHHNNHTQLLCQQTCRLFAPTGYGSVSQSSRDLDRAARKDLNLERRRSKLAELERKEKEAEKAERLAKQRELAKSLADTLRYRPSA